MVLKGLKRIICLFVTAVLLLSTAVVASADEINSLDDLKGAKVGVLTGTIFDKIAEEYIENVEVCYFNTDSDTAAALDAGKIDAYIIDAPVARSIKKTYPDHIVLEQISEEEYGFVFQKNNPESAELCEQFNEFIAESRKNGLLKEIDERWFGTDESAQIIDYSSIENNSGKTIRFATSTSASAPFTYMKDGQPVGYEVELVVEFCKAYGYKFRLDDYEFSGIMSAVQAGMDDMGASCITITEERKQSMLFSDATYVGGTVVVVKEGAAAVAEEDEGFFASLKDSFTKTFIREGRWKLFVNGIVNTMFITVLSILFGTVLGFIDYLVCRKGNKIANSITRALIALVQGMPVVVLLMILFYIVLGKSGLDGKWVAIIGFSLTFGASVFGMLKTSVGAIDKGQNEAAFALGFSSPRTFFRVILPQASYYFLPMFRSEVVAHIKATAIVGYIAVQDLTKISDIVRTRTYEAFFPLIATAIIYFLLEGLLILVVKNVQFFADKKRRTPEKILKGIKTK